MPKKVTDVTVAQEIKSAANVVITQQETINGETRERLRRVPLDTLLESTRDNYTSIYGQLVDVKWERGSINGNTGEPTSQYSAWIRTADYISLSYQLAIACSLNNKRMLTRILYYKYDTETETYTFISADGASNLHRLITPPVGATHIRVIASTYDYDQEGGGINSSNFDKYSKNVWITYSNLSLLKKLTNLIDSKADVVVANTVTGLLGLETALVLESGYCSSSDGTEAPNNKRLRTGFIPFDENLVIVNKSYSGSGRYIQGFVTLYSANVYPEETPASIYILKTSAQPTGWTNLATNFLNLRDYSWLKPAYFRLSLQWSDSSALTTEEVAGMVSLINQKDGQITNSIRGQSGTDLLYQEDNIRLTGNHNINFYAPSDERPVLISMDASYALAAGMAINPVNAEVYSTYAAETATDMLNDTTAAGYDEDHLVTYYLKTGEELNGRLEISQTLDGPAIGWINACHATLPKVYQQWYKTVKSGTVVLYGERYVVGYNGRQKRQQLRLPPRPDSASCVHLSFLVPNGATLNIKSLRVRYETEAQRVNTGVRLDLHGAFFQFPNHTQKTFEIEGACGAANIITIPKRSSDGVWFCYHDDTFPGSILRNDDGTTISNDTAHYGDAFSTIPFADLKDYRIRSDNNSPLEKICLLKDFFDFCAKNGIKPVLSFHPMESKKINDVRAYARDAAEIKELARKCGVLDKLGFKMGSGATTNWTAQEPIEVPLKVIYGIFGNEIDSYIITIDQSENQVSAIKRTITVYNSLRSLGMPLAVDSTIELFENKATPAHIAAITEAGYRAGLAQPAATIMGIDGSKRSVFHSNDYDYWISKGVTRFTTNKTASMGLNW